MYHKSDKNRVNVQYITHYICKNILKYENHNIYMQLNTLL